MRAKPLVDVAAPAEVEPARDNAGACRMTPAEATLRGAMPLQARALTPLALLIALLACAVPAAAQHDGVSIKRPFAGERPTELNLHAGISHFGVGLGLGARLAIPIVDNGFVTKINNAVYLTVGGDLLFERCWGCDRRYDEDYGIAVAIPLTGRWQFNFTPRWSAYGEIGPNIYFHSHWLDHRFPGVGRHPGAWLAAAVGGKWHFAPRTSLTLSLGAPYSHVGLDIFM